jgi:phospholipid-translocating ATPase
MEMKKLHMGTMSFGSDTMDEVVHQLNTAFGVDGEPGRYPAFIPSSLVLPRLGTTHAKHGSLSTGVQLATRGRRDMSARIRDVVLSLALCHNVCSSLFFAARLPHDE